MMFKAPTRALHSIKQPSRLFSFSYFPRMIFLGILVSGFLTAGSVSSAYAASDASQPAVNLLDAGDRSAVKTGEAKAILTPTFDESLGKDVLDLTYHFSQPVSIVAKNFPAGLKSDTVNRLKAGVRTFAAGQSSQISAVLEIKGTKGTQTLPLTLKDNSWSFIQKPIEWTAIGEVTETVFVLTPSGDISGSLSLALEFYQQLPPAPKKPAAPAPAAPKAEEISVKVETAKAVIPVISAPRSHFTFMDASVQDVFKDEPSKASVVATVDDVIGKDVLEFDYAVNEGRKAGVVLKGFPSDLTSSRVDAVRFGARVQDAAQAAQISAALEIKGTAGTQTIPILLKQGWESSQINLDWETLGNLKEVLFSVASAHPSEAKGMLSLTVEFVRKSAVREVIESTEDFKALFDLLDSGAKGVFNIGPSNGNISTVFDETLGKDIWAFQYSVPSGSHVGIWTQEYPEQVQPRNVNVVRAHVRVPDAKQLSEVSVKIEIKGANGMQTLGLKLKPGRNFILEPIQWNTIGKLKEAVFVVSPKGLSEKPMTGTIDLNLEFGKASFWQMNFAAVKLACAVLAAFFAAFLFSLFGQASKPERAAKAEGAPMNPDLFYGIFAVLLTGLALNISALGAKNPLAMDFGFLAVALMGGVVAEFVKFKFTGKHLTSAEAFQNVFITGFLAASSSPLEILQAPSGWIQLLSMNAGLVSLTFLIYHVANAVSLASSQKHLKPITGALIVGTPYVLGWLLLVQNVNFLQKLSNGLTFGIFSAWPLVLQILGRVLVIWAFNEIVINAVRYAKKGEWLKPLKAHAVILGVSLSVALAPEIADWGSHTAIASLPFIFRALISILTVMLSYAGLWGEVYLITGMISDGIYRTAPSLESISKNVTTGMKKGMAYSGILLALLYILDALLRAPGAQALMQAQPIATAIIVGALSFPFLKTIIETFDGSMPFFERTQYSYRDVTLYFRGAIVGFGFAYLMTQGLFQASTSDRILFGCLIGLLASGGISVLRDLVYGMRGQGKIQTWKLYLTDSIMGAFVGSALSFYLDALQIPVVVEKFKLYTSSGFSPVEYITYPLLNKWGRIDLGTYAGGAKLLFTESLAGVINWSIAAWLFAVNKVFMQAFFDKETAPIKFFFSKEGFKDLVNHMLFVLRWGLWMSPIIFTFLRMMPDPTWYNQDGAIRTLIVIFHHLTHSPEAFREWSLNVFIGVLAFDIVRILIWMDHMGLRVATLVNLSFIGMEKLDDKVAKFIGPAAAQRYIPEGVKRFTTWAPLLIPFYLPRGDAWTYAWSKAESIQNAQGGGLVAALQSLSLGGLLLTAVLAVAVCSVVSFFVRQWSRKSAKRRIKVHTLSNREYRTVVKETGEAYSEVLPLEFFDVTRRAYDIIDPAGRILFLVDPAEEAHSPKRFWPVLGNFPRDQFPGSKIEKDGESIKISNQVNGIKTTIEMALPDSDSTAELWTLKVENLSDKPRSLKMVPYLEWVLNGWIHDRFHTQYARLYPEMEYISQLNAILTWHKSTKAMGFLAADIAPEGFLSSRMDFIGRAQSIWKPRVFETLHFSPAVDTAGYPTFDPIGSLAVDVSVEARGSKQVRLLIGYAKNKAKASELIQKLLKPTASQKKTAPAKKKSPLIGHGEILPGTPHPYSEYTDKGNKLVVHTPFTPRPYDHAMSNALHSVMVTNRGLHTSCNGNSQQNRLTPDWADTVTREIPSEAIYLYDAETREWFSPTYHPLNQDHVKYVSEFSVDGTALFKMESQSISTELTVFVPPQEPTGVYLLTIKNHTSQPKKIRVAPYFQLVLSFQPERAGELTVKKDEATGALLFQNPRNIFRTGWAFASMSLRSICSETRRGRFFGTDRGVKHPFMVEQGKPDTAQLTDDKFIAGFVGAIDVPAQGESTVAVVLGQAETHAEALQLVKKYKQVETAQMMLEKTRGWWMGFMSTLGVESNHPEFDGLQNWLKYQALAERIWARRGFYQTSGAYGYRDQLQDTVNLMWVDPALARKQIILHASHQFVEGDVFHWFFTLPDGRTAFSCRSHASDNPAWLPWAVVEYLRHTKDETLLDEMASYVISEFPFAPLPKNKHGWGHLYHRATRADSVYRHCLRSLDLILDKRTGKNGLPLIQTGDWNDGLDEIGSEGKGESVWLGFFVYYILKEMVGVIEKKEGKARKDHYASKMQALKFALEKTWREDRYLRAFHDDGTEIGIKNSGIWEIDALTAAWAVMSGINFERNVTVFNTALSVLEKDNAILLGWPALREDTKPYLGRSSKYPEGVRENGMYSHGVQWMVKAARILAEEFEHQGNRAKAAEYRETAYRLWRKISPLAHITPHEIEIYGGQPNKQAADILTNFDQGRMIWHGYTGAAGWMLRQAFEGVIGASVVQNKLILPADLDLPRGKLKIKRVFRDIQSSPLSGKPVQGVSSASGGAVKKAVQPEFTWK